MKKNEPENLELWAMQPAVKGWEILINGVWRDGIANSETLEHIVEEHNRLVRSIRCHVQTLSPDSAKGEGDKTFPIREKRNLVSRSNGYIAFLEENRN